MCSLEVAVITFTVRETSLSTWQNKNESHSSLLEKPHTHTSFRSTCSQLDRVEMFRKSGVLASGPVLISYVIDYLPVWGLAEPRRMEYCACPGHLDPGPSVCAIL